MQKKHFFILKGAVKKIKSKFLGYYANIPCANEFKIAYRCWIFISFYTRFKIKFWNCLQTNSSSQRPHNSASTRIVTSLIELPWHGIEKDFPQISSKHFSLRNCNESIFLEDHSSKQWHIHQWGPSRRRTYNGKRQLKRDR